MEKSQIQTLPGIHRRAHKFHIFTQSQQSLALFTHLSDDMSISRCVQHWQIFAYVKQAPTLFEVLLNRLPHFTTDTLSHSSVSSSIWSCNMNTCIQTQEHSRKYKVMLTLFRFMDQISFTKVGFLRHHRFSVFGFLCYQVHCIWKVRRQRKKEKYSLLPAALFISSFMCSYFL